MTVIAGPVQVSMPAGAGSIKPAVDVPVGSNQMLAKIVKIGWPGDGQKVGDFTLACTVQGVRKILMKADVYDVADDPSPLTFADSIPDTLDGHRRLEVAWNLLSDRQAIVSIEANTVALKA